MGHLLVAKIHITSVKELTLFTFLLPYMQQVSCIVLHLRIFWHQSLGVLVFSIIRICVVNKTRSWNHLLYTTVILVLIRWYIYIEKSCQSPGSLNSKSVLKFMLVNKDLYPHLPSAPTCIVISPCVCPSICASVCCLFVLPSVPNDFTTLTL